MAITWKININISHTHYFYYQYTIIGLMLIIHYHRIKFLNHYYHHNQCILTISKNAQPIQI